MMDDYGVDGMRSKIEEQFGRRLENGTAHGPSEDTDHIGVHAQKQPGLVYIGVPVPSGKVTGTMLGKLAGFVEEVDGDVRFTRQQNFILANIPEMAKYAKLSDDGTPDEKATAEAQSTAEGAEAADVEEEPDEPAAPPRIEEAEAPKPAPQPAREVEQAARAEALDDVLRGDRAIAVDQMVEIPGGEVRLGGEPSVGEARLGHQALDRRLALAQHESAVTLTLRGRPVLLHFGSFT
mgnify:CR=1 FL=1